MPHEGIEVLGGADRLRFEAGEDGTAVGEVCRKFGISEATFCNWRKRYAGLISSTVKRLRQFEEGNAKLKRILADLSPDKAMVQDVLQKALSPARRRQLVDQMRAAWKVLVRKACEACGSTTPSTSAGPASRPD